VKQVSYESLVFIVGGALLVAGAVLAQPTPPPEAQTWTLHLFGLTLVGRVSVDTIGSVLVLVGAVMRATGKIIARMVAIETLAQRFPDVEREVQALGLKVETLREDIARAAVAAASAATAAASAAQTAAQRSA